MNKNKIFLWLLAAVVLVAVWWLAQYSQTPQQFLLQVENQSSDNVDQVRLFGTALEQDALLLHIVPGGSSAMTVAIKPSGTLKFEVSQGLNRIDIAIVEDTRVLEKLEQRLVVHDNNRFILGGME